MQNSTKWPTDFGCESTYIVNADTNFRISLTPSMPVLQIAAVRRHTGLSHYFNFWHSGALALSPEHQSARMSKN